MYRSSVSTRFTTHHKFKKSRRRVAVAPNDTHNDRECHRIEPIAALRRNARTLWQNLLAAVISSYITSDFPLTRRKKETLVPSLCHMHACALLQDLLLNIPTHPAQLAKPGWYQPGTLH